MKKNFSNFIKNRPTLAKECEHSEKEWCNNCLNFPSLVTETLPDGTVTVGYYSTNKAKYK